ncbi:MAG: hypothetical protein EA357_11535 [Micavibrio sp.]|nr:MAG: hypothetical protein EA357_11535 [Micavibrio sp.]
METAEIKADSTDNGDGGTIIVWSDLYTTTRGSYYARGGANGGNGGFVETSSAGVLDFVGSFVNTSAAYGTSGVWLLDPATITVDAAMAGTINVAVSNVSLVADDSITFAADINMVNAGVGLSAEASTITMNNQSITTNGGHVTFTATGDGGSGNNRGQIDINNGEITTGGGNIAFTATGDGGNGANRGQIKINNSEFTTGGGGISFTATGNGGSGNNRGGMSLNTTDILTSGGSVSLVATYSGGSGNNRGEVSINNSDVDATGGGSGGSFVLTENGATWTGTDSQLADLFGNSNTFETTANGGSITISGRIIGGNNNCFAAGGTSCLVSGGPAIIYITITANSDSKFYGELDPVLTYDLSGGSLQTGDAVLLSRDAGENVGTYWIDYALTNTSGTTYEITYNGAFFEIIPADLVISANNVTKTYGDWHFFNGTEFTADGLKFSDTVNSVNLGSLGQLPITPVGDYTIFAGGATGSGLSNYNITYNTGTLQITPASLTITAWDAEKDYGNTHVFGSDYTVSGLKNFDRVFSVSLDSDGAPAPALPGDYDITASNASGFGLRNYDITYVNGVLTVNPPTNSGPVVKFDSLGRPVLSFANNTLVLDSAFEPFETRVMTTDVNMSTRGPGPAPMTVAQLAAIETAAGGEDGDMDAIAEQLAGIETAAGGDDDETGMVDPDIQCANVFLEGGSCEIE